MAVLLAVFFFTLSYNGGVHIDSTDIINLQTAVLLDSSNGAGSNRYVDNNIKKNKKN